MLSPTRRGEELAHKFPWLEILLSFRRVDTCELEISGRRWDREESAAGAATSAATAVAGSESKQRLSRFFISFLRLLCPAMLRRCRTCKFLCGRGLVSRSTGHPCSRPDLNIKGGLNLTYTTLNHVTFRLIRGFTNTQFGPTRVTGRSARPSTRS